MEIDPSDILGDARTYLKNKNYSKALEKYQWFYDNAIKIDRSYYGVRLSYCFIEWAELAKEFPPAMDALIALKNNTLESFRTTSSREKFHEYSSISESLECQKIFMKNF